MPVGTCALTRWTKRHVMTESNEVLEFWFGIDRDDAKAAEARSTL